MAQNGNLRVRRTQKLLREALIDLIEENGFDALTVGAITERAMVSRAAFYRNYRDKYDLVEQIFEEAMGALMSAVGSFTPGSERPPTVWVTFFEHIAEYDRLYRALLGRNGSPWFAGKMRASLTEMIRSHAQTPNTPEPLSARVFTDDFVQTMVAGLFVEAITWWLEQKKRQTPKEFASRCAALAAAVFREASAWA